MPATAVIPRQTDRLEGQSAAPTATLVSLRGLRHVIGGRTVIDLPAWSVGAGQHSLVLGPSGSGKTTLLHLIAGLLRPTAGEVTVTGCRLDALSPHELDRLRGREIGIVFQTLHLIGALSVRDNLRLAAHLAGRPRDEERLRRVLKAVGLADRAYARPRQLSQGEAQRVAITRALITGARLILADEPTSALDDRNCARVIDLLLDQARVHGATLIIATHDGRIRDRFVERLVLETRD